MSVTSSLSRIEQEFASSQPLRETLRHYLSLRDFVRLLCTSWTMYASFRRQGAMQRHLQLSDLFVAHCLCNQRTTWCELSAYVRSALETHPMRGLQLELRNRCSTGIAQPFVAINVQPWFAASVKLYKTPFESCCDSRSVSGDSTADRSTAERIRATNEWLRQALREIGVTEPQTDETLYSNYELNKFVFWRRVAKHYDDHAQWMRKQKSNTVDLYRQYMTSVGLDSTPHEILKLR